MKQTCLAALLLLSPAAFAQSFTAQSLNRLRVGQSATEVTAVLGTPGQALAQPGYQSYDYRFGSASLLVLFDSVQRVMGFQFHADSTALQHLTYASAALLRHNLGRAEILEKLGLPLVMDAKGDRVLLLYRQGTALLSIRYLPTAGQAYAFTYTEGNGQAAPVPIETLQQLKLQATTTEDARRLLGMPSRLTAEADGEFWDYTSDTTRVSLQFDAEGKLRYYRVRPASDKGVR